MRRRQGIAGWVCLAATAILCSGCSLLVSSRPAATSTAVPVAAAPTHAPTRTETPPPTATVPPTSTPAPTATATPPLLAKVTLKAVVLREGPGTNRRVISQAVAGDQIGILSRTVKGDWLEVATVNGQPRTGWISTRVVELLVPVEAIPFPTLTPVPQPPTATATIPPNPTASLSPIPPPSDTPTLAPSVAPTSTPAAAPPAEPTATPAEPASAPVEPPPATFTPVPPATATPEPTATLTPLKPDASATATREVKPDEAPAGTWRGEANGIRVVVTDLHPLQSLGYRKAGHGSRFVGFTLTIYNDTNSLIRVNPFDVRLVDQAGNSYVFDAATFAYGQQALRGAEIPPGGEAAGRIAFLLDGKAEPSNVIVNAGDYFFRNTIEVDVTGSLHQD